VDLQLDGKRAFVSGSSSGIGKEIAIELAREGCDVVVHGRDKVRAEAAAHEVEALGVKVVVALGDLATEAGCEMVAEEVMAGLGAGLQIVVNNAGMAVLKENPPWSEVPFRAWQESFEVNFMAAARMSKLLLPGIKASAWGRYINISTGAATVTPVLVDYGAAKAALNKLTADMAKDVGRFNATANSIAPGVTRTPALEDWLAIVAAQRGWGGKFEDWERRYITELSPQAVNRFARPEDIARVVTFVASPLSGYISGVVLKVDGGSSKTVYM
jgi:3-oxoacyl-[acyl-carrier protein] reductase